MTGCVDYTSVYFLKGKEDSLSCLVFEVATYLGILRPVL